MTAILLAVLAGGLTTLSPCVLPIVPVVVLGALQRHAWAPVAVVVGMAAAFTSLGVALASAGAAGLSHDAVRVVGAGLMIAVALVLLSARAQSAFARISAPLSARLSQSTSRFAPEGLAGHALLGMLLGAIWTPCAGPTVGAAVGLAASSEHLPQAAAIMFAFSVGAGMPMLALAYSSRRVLQARRERLTHLVAWAKPTLGLLLLVLGASVLLGADRAAESWLAARTPEWLLELATRY